MLVRQFRQILLWPLQLMPTYEGMQIQRHWELLAQCEDNPWSEVADEFTGDPRQFQERHYNEFVTFLPYVQRFLYGEGLGAATGNGYGESPIKVFRRRDVASVRMTHPGRESSTTFDVAHIDLYFFYDLDVAVLVVEIVARDLPLDLVQETLFRFGRAYPTSWHEGGRATNCPTRVEWLSVEGSVLAVSDYERREKYLAFVGEHRAPRVASHWEYLLKPLVSHHSDKSGLIRYRQLEYFRMPLMAYLAVDDPFQLSRADFVHLALVTVPRQPQALPYSRRYLRDFEKRYCYDLYWEPDDPSSRLNTRFLCSGHAFVMVGDAGHDFYTGLETGRQSQFRHQFFLLFLIAHFHKAALLMLSDRMITAISKIDIVNPDSVRRFKRAIRQTLGIFLRFTHRYWFHEIADQTQAQMLYRLTAGHLGTERLYAERREEIQDMSQYLEGDGLRRQANTVVRLTVVTTFGLIGTVATGFLGMTLIVQADPLSTKIAYFLLVFLLVAFLTFYTIVKSKRLSDFLETLSDERVTATEKLTAFLRVWKPPAIDSRETDRIQG